MGQFSRPISDICRLRTDGWHVDRGRCLGDVLRGTRRHAHGNRHGLGDAMVVGIDCAAAGRWHVVGEPEHCTQVTVKLRLRHGLLVTVCITATINFIAGLWIPVKAELAQFLLERAWQRTLAGDSDAKPWPWADTRAVAVLEVPRLGLREVVLAGSSGRNLAFGPTLVNTTKLDLTADRILSGHRDTHFRFLKKLEIGDVLTLHTATRTREYRVTWQEPVDTRWQQLVIDERIDRLTLLTCYPFDAATTGGPLRWVVTALPYPAKDDFPAQAKASL